ncbi:hypothetical protein L596_015578 [Steinernema carpocapsae]|uniref:Uncharacterized protein n=1 Tax=Steinernema carpocapsae TaxID=34508 RepID=A0A4V6A356_STECR|nr:hypothetical protein L596_015578 [Steinernema carpocapsae]
MSRYFEHAAYTLLCTSVLLNALLVLCCPTKSSYKLVEDLNIVGKVYFYLAILGFYGLARRNVYALGIYAVAQAVNALFHFTVTSNLLIMLFNFFSYPSEICDLFIKRSTPGEINSEIVDLMRATLFTATGLWSLITIIQLIFVFVLTLATALIHKEKKTVSVLKYTPEKAEKVVRSDSRKVRFAEDV